MSPIILMKQLKVQGFIVVRWWDQWPAAFKEMAQWIQEVETTLYMYMHLKNSLGGKPLAKLSKKRTTTAQNL